MKSGDNYNTSLHRKISLLFLRLTFALSRKHRRRDFQIAMFFPDKREHLTVAFPKIDAALSLISEFDPRRYRQAQRDVKKILVFPTPPYWAEWVSELQMCVLDRAYLCRMDILPAQIAATIVHEATHARLDHARIKYSEDLAARIEQICFKSEIAFGKRLPDSEPVIKDAEARLTTPQAYWTHSEFQQRNLDAIAELGKKSTFARFSYPIVKWLVERKRARRN